MVQNVTNIVKGTITIAPHLKSGCNYFLKYKRT